MVDTLSPHYLFKKREVYYYSRHVPKDVREHHKTNRIVFSLKTKSELLALRASKSTSQKLEDYWMTLRINDLDLPCLNVAKAIQVDAPKSKAPLLSEALKTYIRLKGTNKGKVFHRAAARNIDTVIQLLGDRSVDEYSSSDAAILRDHSLGRGLTTASVTRNFSTIRAIINLTLREHGIDARNAFSGVFIPELNDANKRKPIPLDTIRKIQRQCRRLDDDKRWLIALISDTGMRLSEGLGNLLDDIKLDNKVPHIDLKPHPWRLLKTPSSQRKIPLVGSALWAAMRIKSNTYGTPYAFPRYTSLDTCNANSASAALNKWLKLRTPEGCVVHSFRHSLRDRLRAVSYPADLIDSIGGWITAGMGHQYGDGYPLKVKAKMMRKITSTQLKGCNEEG